jgi:hypothetical protein
LLGIKEERIWDRIMWVDRSDFPGEDYLALDGFSYIEAEGGA